MRLNFRGVLCALAAIGLSAISGESQAAYTNVNGPAPGEKNHAEIFASLYGGTFIANPLVPFSFTNGVVRAVRVEDEPGAALSATNPSNPLLSTDQVWDGKLLSATAVGKYALFSQNFGMYDNASGVTYTKFFDVSGYGSTVQGAMANPRTTEFFRLVRGGENGLFSSLRTDNSDQTDHMVTYKIETASSNIVASNGTVQETYLAFFEDKFASHPSDFDYNDLVVKVVLQSSAVPEPTGLALLAAAGIALSRRKR